MLAVDVFHKRGLMTTLATLLVAAALSGCVGSEETVDPSGATANPCADFEGNVLEVRIPLGASTGDAGAGIELPELDNLTTPATLCIVNDDDVAHPFVGLPGALDASRPDWIPASAGSSDPHAAHKAAAAAADGDGHAHAHGADDPTLGLTPIFEHTIEAGKVLAVENFDYHGTITLQSGQFKHMKLDAEILPSEAVDYEVQVNKLVMTATATGDTTAGSMATETYDVQATDLKKVSAKVKWDDSEDDNAAGLNNDDTIKVRLLDPSGTEVATKEATGGQIIVDFEPELAAIPETVTAQGYSAAVEQLKTDRPQDDSTVGTWSVEISVVAAPGALPDEDGSTAGLPVGDGHQAWELEVTFQNVWPGIVPADGSPAPESIVADFE